MTAIGTLPVLLGTGVHGSRPAANAVGSGGLWACSTHGLIYQTDGASWSTWATLSGTETLPVTIIDAKGDLIGGTAADTAARLAVGANGRILTADSAQSTGLAWRQNIGSVGLLIDGGGAEIATGIRGWVEVPFAWGDILSASALADQSGDIVVDIWKDTHANYPPTNADSITASAPVTISTDTDSQDTTLTGWTKTGAQYDVLFFNVDSVTDIEMCLINLTLVKS